MVRSRLLIASVHASALVRPRLRESHKELKDRKSTSTDMSALDILLNQVGYG